MYVDEYLDDHVELKCITAHTNHSLGVVQLPHLALPKTIRGEVAMKISKGIQVERILKGMSSIKMFPCREQLLFLRPCSWGKAKSDH